MEGSKYRYDNSGGAKDKDGDKEHKEEHNVRGEIRENVHANPPPSMFKKRKQ